ncbi:MAG: DUF1566 domain-containing protein [Nitrospirae bacterium]|nr:DUF1566 domain-containing protein [Nitrospirota bacterium]
MFERSNNQTMRYLQRHGATDVRTLLTLALIVVIGGMCINNAAYAGTVSLPQTGQTTSYAAGDDGAIRAGVPWPSPRFTSGSSVVTDNLTGLVWTKNASTAAQGICTETVKKTWQEALDYVVCLNTIKYLGYSDWRLPNVNELESLFNAEQPDIAAWLNTQGVINVANTGTDLYWSSTTFAYDTSKAWTVSIVDGTVDAEFDNASKSGSNNVWPVRTGQSGASTIWATGQKISYAAGDDGALQKGVAWPSPRFTSNTDQTVTDNLTGLIWSQDASTPNVSQCQGGTKEWQEAFDYIKCLNYINYLNHNDWRLPNRKELISLIDFSQNALPSDNPFINLQAVTYCLSSTTLSVDAEEAWQVHMALGLVYIFSNTLNGYVWPVRGGYIAPTPTPAKVTLTLTKQGNGDGMVTSAPSNLLWNLWNHKTATGSFDTGTLVTLTPTPTLGSKVKGWTGCKFITGNMQCVVEMTADKGVVVQFAKIGAVAYDFDGDGKSDLFFESNLTDNAALWLVNGLKHVSSLVSNVPPGWKIRAVADFDGDGKVDILLQNPTTGGVVIWFMDGAKISSYKTVASVSYEWYIRGVGDFNGDGKADLLWQNLNTGDVYVWLMDGYTVSSMALVTHALPLGWQIKAVADFNGDGKDDVLLVDAGTTGDTVIWFMDGATIVDKQTVIKGLLSAQSSWFLLTAGDFNGDGNADLMLQNANTGAVLVCLLNGSKIIGTDYPTYSLGSNWHLRATGDYNGDYRDDVVWQDDKTGNVIVWFMNGAKIGSSGVLQLGLSNEWDFK